MDVLKLLQSKNRCLKKFYNLSAEFLVFAEKKEFAGLDSFQAQRESIIKALELYDRKIAEEVAKLDQNCRTPGLVREVEMSLTERDVLVYDIIKIDSQIMNHIEEEKKNIQAEISANKKNQQTVSKFKSEWVNQSGEEFDSKL